MAVAQAPPRTPRRRAPRRWPTRAPTGSSRGHIHQAAAASRYEFEVSGGSRSRRDPDGRTGPGQPRPHRRGEACGLMVYSADEGELQGGDPLVGRPPPGTSSPAATIPAPRSPSSPAPRRLPAWRQAPRRRGRRPCAAPRASRASRTCVIFLGSGARALGLISTLASDGLGTARRRSPAPGTASRPARRSAASARKANERLRRAAMATPSERNETT